MFIITAFNDFIQWFQTGDKPTEQQFGNTLFSLRHKNDKITLNDLEDGVKDAINATAINTNKYKFWIDGTTDVIEADEYKIVPTDYVLNNANLLIKSSINSTNIAGLIFYKKGVMQVAGNVVCKGNSSLSVNGKLYVGGFIFFGDTPNITGITNISFTPTEASNVPTPESGCFVVFMDDNSDYKKKDSTGAVTNF